MHARERQNPFIGVDGMGIGADGYCGDLQKSLWSFLSPAGGAISFSPSLPFVYCKIICRLQGTLNAGGGETIAGIKICLRMTPATSAGL